MYYLLSAFFVYFALLLSFALLFSEKQTTSSGFIMGNRSLNFWVVALSAHASDMSSWLFMAFPMLIFTQGVSHVWIAIGLLLGMFLTWQLVATKLRTMTERYDCYTLSSFFEKRFSDTSGTISLLSAAAMLIFLTHYLSAGFIAMGNLLESLFGLNYMIGLTLAVCVVVIYTFFGGFTAVAWTDLFQGLFLLGMIILVPFAALRQIGEWKEITRIAHEREISLALVPDWDPRGILHLVLLAIGWGLGYFGLPHVITKFMGIKNPSELHKAKWLGITWQTIALGAAFFAGLIAIAHFPAGIENPELVFVEMVKTLFHPFVVGFILCGIIAANMSTMDSQILVCSSIISKDLFHYFRKKPPSDKSVLWASQLSVVGISLVALFLAFQKNATIASTVSYSWSGLGSAFGPLVLMSLYAKRANRYGAIAGIVTGTAIVMIWPSLHPWVTTLDVMAIIPGFFGSMGAIYVVSLLTEKIADRRLALAESLPAESAEKSVEKERVR